MPLLLGIVFMEMFKYNDVPSIGVLKKDIIALIRPESKTFFKIYDPIEGKFMSIKRSQMVSQFH